MKTESWNQRKNKGFSDTRLDFPATMFHFFSYLIFFFKKKRRMKWQRIRCMYISNSVLVFLFFFFYLMLPISNSAVSNNTFCFLLFVLPPVSTIKRILKSLSYWKCVLVAEWTIYSVLLYYLLPAVCIFKYLIFCVAFGLSHLLNHCVVNAFHIRFLVDCRAA